MMKTLLSKSLKPLVAVAALGAAFALGRLSSGGPLLAQRKASTGPEVVTYFDQSLQAGELAERMQALGPAGRARLATPERRREFVLQQARLESMAEEARAKEYDRDPELQRRYLQELTALYLRREFEEPQAKKVPTEAEVAAYLQTHRGEWARPQRLRVARIFLAAPAADPARRRAAAAQAEQLLQKARAALARDLYAFAALAREHSQDEQSRLLGGDLQALTREELGRKLGPEALAALEETQEGQVAPRVVERPEGFEILQLVSREAAVEPKLEDLREVLTQRLVAERRVEAHKRFLEELDQRAGIRIDGAAVATLQAP